MDLILFCTAFILQFVGHRIGDYFFQTDWQAQNKAKNPQARFRHVFVYSLTCALMMSFAFGYKVCVLVYLITLIEHYIIDSRKPVIGWKKLLERVVGNKAFDIEKFPFFVLIEIDQTIHIMRIFVISLLIGYSIL